MTDATFDRTFERDKWLAILLIVALAGYATYYNLTVPNQFELPNVKHKFSFEYEDEKQMLGPKTLRLYYGVGLDGRLIYRGSGGDEVNTSMLGNDTLLIRHCGGQPLFTEKRFQDMPEGMPPESNRWIAVKVVTKEERVWDGRLLCPGQ